MKQAMSNVLPLRLKKALPNMLVGFLIVFFSSYLMISTFGYEKGNFLISSRLWSDFGAHLPLIRSFSRGANFPPQYPHYAHEPIQYHYGFYLMAGMLEKSGLPIDWAVNLPSVFGLTLLLWMIYVITSHTTGTRIAGLIAVLLFACNGSLTFIDYFRQNGLSLESVASIATLKEFVNFGPWNGDHISAFWNLNIYTNQRHLGLSYALVLVMLWPIVAHKISRKNRHQSVAWILVLLGMSIVSPLIHKAIIPMTAIVYLVWGVLHPRQLRFLIPLLAAMGVTSLPLYKHVTPFAEMLTYHPGYLAQGERLLDWLIYWLWNVGAYVVIVPLALFRSSRAIKALTLSSLILFGVANLFQMSADMINNHKLINFSLILWAMVAADLAIRLGKKRLVGVVASALLVFGLTLSGFIDLAPIINDRLISLPDAPNSQAQSWIQVHTPKRAVFLSSHKFYNPASLAGRLLYFGYSYFPWSMGYDIGEREAFSREIFAPTTSVAESCSMLQERHIDYVIISAGAGEIGDTNVQVSAIAQSFVPLYENKNEGHTIYSVRDNCATL